MVYMNTENGVSIVICCHNSSNLLPETLRHICSLKVISEIKWEVIVIDNASEDNTSEIAKKLLEEYKCPVKYRVLFQPELGLSNARRMGFENSEYNYILFCDDDNWLEESYIETGFKILESDSKIGALGGQSEAVIQGKIPVWFTENSQNYSVGKQSEKSGDITFSHGVLWGAGLYIRKYALAELYSSGFNSLLTDRKGNQLTSGGDTEKCYALRLAGWKIWYDERLKLKHFIPEKRLEWNYLRKLSRGYGAQKVNIDPYINALNISGKTITENKWHKESLRLLLKLRGYGFRKLLILKNSSEGNKEVLRIEKTIGKLNELLKVRGKYNYRIKDIKEAKWRKNIS